MASALDALASTVRKDPVRAWQQVQGLVPQYGKSIGDLVKALTALTQRPRRKSTKYRKVAPLRGACTVCHGDLPHRTPAALSRHGHHLKLYRTRRDRWAKYPFPEDRQAQNSLARLTILRERHDRALAALRVHNPLVFDHQLKTLGREALITLWRSLPKSQKRRLLRAVPPLSKRRFKGEILVRKGLRLEKPCKGTQ